MNIKDIADIALVESGVATTASFEAFAADAAIDNELLLSMLGGDGEKQNVAEGVVKALGIEEAKHDMAVALTEDAIDAIRSGEDQNETLESLIENIKGLDNKGDDNQ